MKKKCRKIVKKEKDLGNCKMIDYQTWNIKIKKYMIIRNAIGYLKSP